MALPSDETTRHLRKLATLVVQQRVALGFPSKEAAAEACGISHMTYRKIEGGQSVRDATYAKLEIGFRFRPGSCKAVADGVADSITLEDGSELIDGGKITRFNRGHLEEELRGAITKSVMLTAPDLTLRQVEAMNERVVEELRKRGLLP
jgi:hypothetical protein